LKSPWHPKCPSREFSESSARAQTR
jgi:hypothetical protein